MPSTRSSRRPDPTTSARRTCVAHEPRILRAARYAIDHLAEPLTVRDVAKVAAMSEFHFQRVFAAVMDETVGAFIARRRLELAALKLAYQPGRSVTEVALSSGYSSTANFSKAFAAYFGCRPSDVQRPDRPPASRLGKLLRRHGKDFDPHDLYALPTPVDEGERERRRREVEDGMHYEQRSELPLACLRSRASGYDARALGATWDRLIRLGRQLGLCGEEADAYGLAHDSPQLTVKELVRYDACIPYDGTITLPAPLFRSSIAAGRYAVFRYRGPVEGVAPRMRDIYSLAFDESSVEPDDRFLTIDHYVNDAPVDGQIDMEILIKVRPRT